MFLNQWCASIPYFLRNIFPENILQAGFQHQKTEYVEKQPEKKFYISLNKSGDESLSTPVPKSTTPSVVGDNITEAAIEWVRSYPMADGVNVLGKYFSLNQFREKIGLWFGRIFTFFYIIKWNFLYVCMYFCMSVCMYPYISRNTACTALKIW